MVEPAVRVAGLSDIADGYDLFLVDQWGVLHDGASPYPGALDALGLLTELGKPVVILSNSARRVDYGIERMAEIGIPRDMYANLVTSGEETWQHLRHRPDAFYRSLGRRCLLYSWGGDRGLTHGVDVETVDSVEQADFILNAGTNREPIEWYVPELSAGVGHGLPMICANPDLVSVTPEGELIITPGTVARKYEELGGYVRWHGKPDRSVYETCFALYPRAERILGIGDSLHHDVAGARGAGIDCLFVAGGIHAPELGIAWGGEPAEDALSAAFAEAGQRPDYVVATFRR